MPNPEPTLAEICKTVREMEAELDAAHAEMEDWVAGRIRTVNANRVYHAARALSEWIAPHALTLVQAAEEGEKYEKALRTTQDQLIRIATASTLEYAKAIAKEARRDNDQALSSGAPPSIRMTLGGTTNPNGAARGGSST